MTAVREALERRLPLPAFVVVLAIHFAGQAVLVASYGITPLILGGVTQLYYVVPALGLLMLTGYRRNAVELILSATVLFVVNAMMCCLIFVWLILANNL